MAAIGHNSGLNIPTAEGEAIKFIVQRAVKLLNERKLTADMIRDIKRAAKNDGFKDTELASALRIGRMTPEKRLMFVAEMSTALRLYGFSDIGVAGDDDVSARAQALRAVVIKTRALEADKKEIAEQLADLYGAAKDRGMDTKALRQIVRVARLDEEDRESWFANVDRLGAFLGYW